jgi:ribosomal protein S18 acetylase RimI-like enzyme
MIADTKLTDPHIRLIYLRKDLQPVADLVEMCFADYMDAEGKSYLRHIRSAGSDANSIYLDAATPETSQIPFHGYVWEEDGQIIGNVTLICTKKRGQPIYFIANVAGNTAQRNRGIARELTMRVIKHVMEHGGKSVVLQVREDNPAAIHIYESLGFSEISRRTNWVWDETIPRQKRASEAIQVTGRNSEDWPQQKLWLEANYPENVAWFLPFQLANHEPGFLRGLIRWIDSESIHFWAARDARLLLGLASLESVNPFQDYLWIASSPAFEEKAIQTLVPFILNRVRKPQKILINYPAHRAEQVLQQVGMKVSNTLIWMEKRFSEIPW